MDGQTRICSTTVSISWPKTVLRSNYSCKVPCPEIPSKINISIDELQQLFQVFASPYN